MSNASLLFLAAFCLLAGAATAATLRGSPDVILASMDYVVKDADNQIAATEKDLEAKKSTFKDKVVDEKKVIEKLHKVDSEKDRVQVKSICMDDLIPFVGSRPVFMKMDIEGSEHTALSCAHHLFNTANITVVQMEWKQRSQEEITQITNFMAGHGYTPSLRWDAVKEVDINVSTVRPGENVYFVRRLDTLGRSLIPMIYLITPTYRRPSQKADLTRLVYTFRHVPRLHWIVVEDSDNKTSIVSRLLETSGLSYTHLNVSSPNNGSRSTWMKGVMQRNAGLAWIRDNTEPDKDAVVYFADFCIARLDWGAFALHEPYWAPGEGPPPPSPSPPPP